MTRLTLLTLLCAVAQGTQISHPCTINGKSFDIMAFDNAKNDPHLTGKIVCKDSDGKVYSEYQHQDGKKIWEMEYNMTTYQPERESRYDEAGAKHGNQKQFSSSGKGKVEFEWEYFHGQEQGVQKSFHDNGKLREQSYYEKGERRAALGYTENGAVSEVSCTEKAAPPPFRQACGFDGPQTHTLHHTTGTANATVTYQNGVSIASTEIGTGEGADGGTERKLEGEGKIRLLVAKFPNGKPKTESRWDPSLNYHGYQREFDESGSKVKESLFDHGQLVSQEEFYLNGQTKEKMTAQYENDRRAIRTYQRFHDNGQLALSAKQIYSLQSNGYGQRWQEIPDGTVLTFRADGTADSIENWKEGKREGRFAQFQQDGKTLTGEAFYKNDQITRVKEYTKGALVRDDEVFKDGSRKSFLKKRK